MQRLCDWVKGRSISVSYIYIDIYIYIGTKIQILTLIGDLQRSRPLLETGLLLTLVVVELKR